MNRYKYIDENGEHLHTLDGAPLYGTSSVTKVLAKPLTWWASGLAVKEFGCPDPKVLTKIKNKKATLDEHAALNAAAAEMHQSIVNMTVPEYIKLLDRAYRAHDKSLDKSADEGTDLHAELEAFVRDEIVEARKMPEAYPARILPFITWARKNVAHYLWCEGHCYSEKHWLGGISDVGFIDTAGKAAILDFKSSKDAYLSQFWQCTGYAISVEENGIFDKDGNNLLPPVQKIDYVAVLPFGMVEPQVQINVDVDGGKEAFLAMLTLYKKLPRD